MKNIFVVKHYNITDNFFCYSDMSAVANHYKNACDIVIESAKKYLHDIDKVIIHRRTVKNDQEMFKDHAELLKELYHSEDCNILYCDLDVVFIKPTRIFGEYEDFTMIANNCGVRYYPAGGMKKHQWDIQEGWVSRWQTEFDKEQDRIHHWQYEQDMFIEMHKSVMAKHKYINPFEKVVHQVYNPPVDGYTMVHCCGTSQQFNGVKLMAQLYDLSLSESYNEIHNLLSEREYSERRNSDSGSPWLGLT
tara:strand:- start:251 stop:994 length:744 start_codon:yes stop_codon:yes gene_type:complete